MNKMES